MWLRIQVRATLVRPGASDFSVGPVNSQPDKSAGLVFLN